MRVVRLACPVAAALGVVGAVTALFWYLKLSPHHLVFYYLLPTVAVAILFGNLSAMVCAVAGALYAAYFMYDPVFSFYIANRLEVGEFVCFSVLAVLSSKCATDILRPTANSPPPPDTIRQRTSRF